MTSRVSIIGLGLVCCCWLSVLFLVVVSAASDDAKDKDSPKLDVICLGCICEAASGCNQTLGCVGDVCGPFHITQIYWTDSGKPTLDSDKPEATDEEAFARCVNDVNCAARAVQGYMEKYSQDCNGDGVIDCEDYARIHYLGGYGCSAAAKLDKNYAKAFNFCQKAFQAV
ncbi:lysozyme 2-like [Trichogramma pretiosum]|uniref:lysozyme 2-like n=1 Tax=Trichogramma pretiosum TaxID=7493 RepID=UPI0006C9B812|nr:lysozyme 2-like [Trichogramma pretiosum]